MRLKITKRFLVQVLFAMLIIPNVNIYADINDAEPIVGQEYEAKKVNFSLQETENPYLSERIEYKLKFEVLNTITILEPKTDSKYEVALAHEDGSFTYVDSVESMDEAIKEVEVLSEELKLDPEGTVDKLTNMSSQSSSATLKTLNTATSGETTLPTVINNSGQIIYSTNAMARIIKYVSGKPDTSGLKTTSLYSSSSLASEVGYINHMFVEDAPILQDDGASAKILVSALEGWIKKDTSKTEYDMVVVPLNQVKNPSYYIVQNGELRHFLSSDLTGSSGYTITIGKAPSYLTAGVRYFSYDGLYFYSGQNIESGLNTLINDYKSGTRANSVNAESPFYLYFNNLPFRSETVYTAAELNKFIDANTQSTSKLRGLGVALKEAEKTYGVNAALTLGVAINESGWGMSSISQSKNNLFSINAIDSDPERAANDFATPAAAVNEFTKNYISRGYADPADWRYNGGFLGNKKSGANVKYASDPFWGEKAAQFAYRIDKYLAGSINALKDTDYYQLAMTNKNNKVIKADGSLLYNITNDKTQYAAYVGTPFIVTNNIKESINGQNTYEINPERTTPVNTGGTSNKFIGTYDWFIKGYVLDSGIEFLNQGKERVVKPLVVSAPTSISAVANSYNSVKVSWTEVLGASGYAVYRFDSSTGTYTYLGVTTETTYINTGLAINKTYYYKVKAYRNAGTTQILSGYTPVVGVKPVLAAPILKASANTYNSVKISWTGITGASGYAVYRFDSSNGTYTYLGVTAGTSYVNNNLITNRTYYYKVKAYRNMGTTQVLSGYSPVIGAKPSLAAPSLRASSYSYNSVKISWSGITGASGYAVYRFNSSDGTYTYLGVTAGTSYINANLIKSRTYYYKVKAYRNIGTSRIFSGYSAVIGVKAV